MDETLNTSKPKKRARGKYSDREKAKTKAVYLSALAEGYGIKETARAAAQGVAYDTIEAWKREDPEFAAAEEAALDRGCEEYGDLAEGALVKRIKREDTTAIIFALKTKFKNRGYIEKKEIAANVDGLTQTILVNDAGEKSALENLNNLGV